MPESHVNATAVPIRVSDYPKLDTKQAGHLRHFHNLVSQRDGEWNHFGSLEGQQEWDDAYRYQLATMAYAIGVTHYHRLPAIRGPFKRLLRQVIHKMLRREVWGYWFSTSHGGTLMDPDLKELRKPWADPVIHENIMYSGHLLLMTSLYAMLFDDDEFEKEGGLTFVWDPVFWGLGKQTFVYDNRSLQDVIFKQMEANDWVGVCCEPNAVFVVCNQFPIIAMRYNDSRDGTDKISAVLKNYEAALKRKGMLRDDGLYASYFRLKQAEVRPPRHGAHSAWANAFMNTWNPGQARSMFDKQILGFLTDVDGKIELQSSKVGLAFREEVLRNGQDPKDPETLRKAQAQAQAAGDRSHPFETINWGCFMMLLSELGKETHLTGLLDYADKYLMPTWENGGLYYQRNDQLLDADGRMVHMEPHSGNSGIAYGRLNVEDGQRIMWEQPWTREILANRPWVDGVGIGDGVDFLRGFWDAEREATIITLRRWTGEARSTRLCVKNLPEGSWAVYVNGTMKSKEMVGDSRELELLEMVGLDEIDIVVAKADPSDG